MYELTVKFEKAVKSGYFYHAAPGAKSGELSFRKPPVAAKRGYRIKIWVTNPDLYEQDLSVRINGVEEVAEHERGDLFQIHTDKETWEEIVGVEAAPSRSEQHAIARQNREDRWAQEKADWYARRSRDCCVETQWERRIGSRPGGQDYVATAQLPEWLGSAKIYLGEKMGSGQGPGLQIIGAPDPKQSYTLRINNVWIAFWPGYQGSPHHAFVAPEEWDAIFDYEGGQLPDEIAPPRTRNEIRFEGQDLGFSSIEYYEWVDEAKEIQGKVWGVALAYGQLTLFQKNQQGGADRIPRYEAAINRYTEKISVLDEELDAGTIRQLQGRRSEVEGKLAEVRQYVEDYQKKIDRIQDSYNEVSARYKALVARREYWEDGIHPDKIPLDSETSSSNDLGD